MMNAQKLMICIDNPKDYADNLGKFEPVRLFFWLKSKTKWRTDARTYDSMMDSRNIVSIR